MGLHKQDTTDNQYLQALGDSVKRTDLVTRVLNIGISSSRAAVRALIVSIPRLGEQSNRMKMRDD